MRTTPEKIDDLAENEVFVFGSNTGGINGRGAALQAREQWGARNGVGEGFTGNGGCCYALPTLKWEYSEYPAQRLSKRSHGELIQSITRFYRAALINPKKTFLLTKVGCGLAGYDEGYMKQFFRDTPPNVVKPEGW